MGEEPCGFPLHLHATKVYINPVEFNPNFVTHTMMKVEWAGLANKVPKGLIHRSEYVEKFLRKIHHILQEVDVLEGTLQCPGS
ncbi:tRNA methyltransferase 112 like protein [Myotis davidii]|uniref:tRNA methyltransferase 112 like protein n=1 Tax=Myotis davidii TaxID=225400 RepID=L5M4F2_MYODS|nr:tRNA methyltransferase 112 like protein [Myotis davidii]